MFTGWAISVVTLSLVLAAAAPDAPRDPAPVPPIAATATIRAPVKDVWRAWTTNEALQTWFAQRTLVELRREGPFEIYFSLESPEGSRGSEGCKIVSYLPERMLSFTWNAPPKFAHARQERTWVVVLMSASSPTETLVELHHLGWSEQIAAHPDHADEWREVRAYFARAWPRVLESLRERFDETPASGPASPATP